MNAIENYLIEEARTRIERDRKYADVMNTAPCAVCRQKEFIQLFRNVVGSVSGHLQGYYSLFGGSVSGYITGSTSTLPVLSCRNCNNEREIETVKEDNEYTLSKEIFWSEMHKFYFSDAVEKRYYNSKTLVSEIFLEHPKETREFMLKNKNYDYYDYNDLAEMSTEVWSKYGFKIPKVEKKFLFFKWETYPTWDELK